MSDPTPSSPARSRDGSEPDAEPGPGFEGVLADISGRFMVLPPAELEIDLDGRATPTQVAAPPPSVMK